MGKKSLVVHFSCGGTTELIGKELAGTLRCNSHPLKAQEAYTREDLDWKNPQSRSSVEMQDEKARSSYKKLPVDLKDYEQVLLGFPIWWGIESGIVDHSIEQRDLKGKGVIPLATLGGSTADKAQDRLEEEYGQGLTLLRGHRFNRNLERQETGDWLQILSHQELEKSRGHKKLNYFLWPLLHGKINFSR